MTLQMRDQENIEKGRELGREEGRKEEREEGIRLMIAALEEVGISKESIAEKVRGKYQLTEAVSYTHLLKLSAALSRRNISRL